jgi:hypothetical protein
MKEGHASLSGAEAQVEHCSAGQIQILADGLAYPTFLARLSLQ